MGMLLYVSALLSLLQFARLTRLEDGDDGDGGAPALRWNPVVFLDYEG